MPTIGFAITVFAIITQFTKPACEKQTDIYELAEHWQESPRKQQRFVAACQD